MQNSIWIEDFFYCYAAAGLTPIHILRRSRPLATVDVGAGFESGSQQSGEELSARAPSNGRVPGMAAREKTKWNQTTLNLSYKGHEKSA